MFDKLEDVERRFNEIESRLADPEIAGRPNDFRRLSQEHAGLQEIIDEFRIYKKLNSEFISNKELLEEKDSEIVSMARDEIKRLEFEIDESKKATNPSFTKRP